MLMDPGGDRVLGHDHQGTMHLELSIMNWVLSDLPSYEVTQVREASFVVWK